MGVQKLLGKIKVRKLQFL